MLKPTNHQRYFYVMLFVCCRMNVSSFIIESANMNLNLISYKIELVKDVKSVWISRNDTSDAFYSAINFWLGLDKTLITL